MPLGIRASQQVRAVPGDPRRGAIPVELIRSQPCGDFPLSVADSFVKCGGQKSRGVEDK